MGILETIFSSVLGGGVTGILGVVVQRIADYKNKQLDLQLNSQKQEHEIALKRIDAEIMAHEWASRTSIASTEASTQMDVAESQAFAASFNEPVKYSSEVKPTPAQGWMFVLLDFIRGIVRPGLTIYLCVLTTLIYMESRSLMGGSVDPMEASKLLHEVVGTVLYLTTTCLLWWFGVRNKGQKLR